LRIQKAYTELLAFGALISVTDPVSTLSVFQKMRVDPHLFILVFGESVLNDAVGLVLFYAFRQFVVQDNGAGKVVMGVGEFIVGFLFDAVGSPVLGLFCGCTAALLFKLVDMRSNRLLELSVYVLIMYVPFLLAQLMKLSGIVTILFTGMTARSYVVPNISQATAENAEVLFRLFANLAETSIFLELGLSVFGLMKDSLKCRFVLWAFLACVLGRALYVYPISFLYNRMLRVEKLSDVEIESGKLQLELSDSLAESAHKSSEDPGLMRQTTSPQSHQSPTPKARRDLKISWKNMHVLCFSGLRGAVAYACVRSFPNTFGHRDEFTAATMMIVLVTVFLFGSTTTFLLNFLKIETEIDEEKYMENWHRERRSANILLRVEDFIQRLVVRKDAFHPVSPAMSHSVSPETMEYSNIGEEEERNSQNAESSLTSSQTRSPRSLFDFGMNI
jgi:sodium/hydrogen exchanger 8